MADNTPGPSQSVDPSKVLPRGLLGRKGVPIGQGARLPSLGRPRDLTLGGTTKRTYAPNIPVRKERGVDTQTSSERGSFRGVNYRGPRGNGRGRGGERGRGIRTRGGRGRGVTQVQTVGSIFSEGIAQKDIRKGFHGESTRDSSDYIPRPKVDFKKDVRVNKEEEKQKLREILQDDFIDDDDESYEDYLKDIPITLPLLPNGLTKKAKAVKKELKPKPNIKEEKMDIGGVIIKTEPFDMDDDPDMDGSGVLRLKDKSKASIKEEKCETTFDDNDDTNDLSCSKLLRSIQDMEQEELLLFQLPDSLPLLRNSNEDEKPKIKQEPGVGFGVVPEPQKSGTNPPVGATDSGDEVKEGSSLSDMSEGYIGKLQVLKSGKTRLVMGNVIMNVEMGTDVGYLQDIVSLRTSGNTGSLTVLGHSRHRLICVPEIENIFE